MPTPFITKAISLIEDFDTAEYGEPRTHYDIINNLEKVGLAYTDYEDGRQVQVSVDLINKKLSREETSADGATSTKIEEYTESQLLALLEFTTFDDLIDEDNW